MQKSICGLCRPIGDVSRSHKIKHTHTHTPVGRLCESDQLVAEASTYITHNKHKRGTSILLAGLEPAMPATKRLQVSSLDRTATMISVVF
jgi:hypothetical protein